MLDIQERTESLSPDNGFQCLQKQIKAKPYE